MALWNETSEAVPWETWGGTGEETWRDWVRGVWESHRTHRVTGATTGGALVPAVKVSGLGSVSAQESGECLTGEFPEQPLQGETQHPEGAWDPQGIYSSTAPWHRLCALPPVPAAASHQAAPGSSASLLSQTLTCSRPTCSSSPACAGCLQDGGKTQTDML